MKKIVIILVFLLGINLHTEAQIEFGLKGGINYNSTKSIKEIKQDVFKGAKSIAGFHAGVWLRANLHILGLYVRPELVYTQLNNNVTYQETSTSLKTDTNFKLNKIDLPLLVGTKIFDIGHVYIGPSFQYIINSNFGFNELKEIKTSDFSLGAQFGVGLELGKLGLDIRWERSLSDAEMKFISSKAKEINFDARVNQIIISLSYKL